jgi:basic amino acid/polyamine antiporter, APA family
MVVVPLLDPEHTRHALDLACRLAADRGSRILVVAPLFIEFELPLDAHFHSEEAALRVELGRERAVAESYGVRAHGKIVRARHGQLGSAVAEAASDVRASLIVVGAAVEYHHGSQHPFSRDVWSVLHDAPCPVLIATGSDREAASAAA